MLTIYLDHNILDALLKGKVSSIECLHSIDAPTYVYSDGSLLEILNSKGWEVQFLNLLAQLRAKHLVVPHANGRALDGATLSDQDPHSACMALSDARATTSTNAHFGLDMVLQKLYGGNVEESFADVAGRGASDLCTLLDSTLENAKNELSPEEYARLQDGFALLKNQVVASTSKMASALDANCGESPVKDWQAFVNAGPQQLNNISPPNVVQKIWAMLKPHLSEEVTIEVLFGLERPENVDDAPRSVIEQVNAICSALDYVGFYRDRRIKRLRRLHASLADMTHAGYASQCNFLLTDDYGLHRKASAAYEYLALKSQSLYANLKAHEG